MQIGWGERHSPNITRWREQTISFVSKHVKTCSIHTASESGCSVASCVHGGTSASCDWHRQCCHDALCRKRAIRYDRAVCWCLVKLEPCQCRDLASANQANPLWIAKTGKHSFWFQSKALRCKTLTILLSKQMSDLRPPTSSSTSAAALTLPFSAGL